MTVTRILYRGSLTSCNYGCGYCPFAKQSNTREELGRDRNELDRFVDWVEQIQQRVGVLFTPWGEAIIHRYYRQAMVRLSRMDHVHRVAIQTNLSGHLDDLKSANRDRLGIWATYHPDETTLDRFLERCSILQELGIRYSVGVVGFREHFGRIAELRQRLPAEVYLWINVPKSSGIQYSDDESEFLGSIDPYYRWNADRWPSLGKPCQAGSLSFTVDGSGDVRRCHFVDRVIGNIYQGDIFSSLKRRTCPNMTCGCHIGYVNRDDFQLDRIFGDNILERIPAVWPLVESALTTPPQ